VPARAGRGSPTGRRVGDVNRAPPLAGSEAVRAEYGDAEAVTAAPTGVDSVLTVSASETSDQGRRYDELLMGVVWCAGHPWATAQPCGGSATARADRLRHLFEHPMGCLRSHSPRWRIWYALADPGRHRIRLERNHAHPQAASPLTRVDENRHPGSPVDG
jgi:hypothetical protein